ncbi:MAG TPA: V-type ATP synthase subunit A [Bradyrhizobium sp.]|nr:V-type ATP synthase subunit A [Bradyrhizobium sp.]
MRSANPLPTDVPPVRARIVAVRPTLVTAVIESGSVRKNEVGYILSRAGRLKAEVMRVRGRVADLQVFEDTRGISVGDGVDLTGELLSVTLGPGLLGQVYDGLQNPLTALAQESGYFLRRGVELARLDRERRWRFDASVAPNATVAAGDVLGAVQEKAITHRILVPALADGTFTVRWIERGEFRVDDHVAEIVDAQGKVWPLTLAQRWPVRRPFAEPLLRARRVERVLPRDLLVTGQRIIDTFFPIAVGGTACIPGPFGAGKTVLQGLIARFANVDVVVIVACGERAGEVVETITEFPQLADPRTGATLADRTVIICNTSSMPVAARESSIYTGVTIGEYYRQMGLNVLVIADSTSRWAQALRETSGRMEEIPGDEAYPAYLDSSIRAFYERAGVIRWADGRTGSLSIVGTVSPPGGNLEEPVTQATLSTVKCFLGLSADRAYRRAFPAIDPMISWSRYGQQLAGWNHEHFGSGWETDVAAILDLLRRGDEIERLMQVTGEEGVTLDDFVIREKARLADAVYLQQDGLDPVDRATPPARSRASLSLLLRIVRTDHAFPDKATARECFARFAALFKNLNYSPDGSEGELRYRKDIEMAISSAAASK